MVFLFCYDFSSASDIAIGVHLARKCLPEDQNLCYWKVMSRDDISILIFDQHIFFIEKNSIYFFVSISHKENIKKKKLKIRHF